MLQLPLDFELKVDATFDNFIPSGNLLLLEAMQSITSGQQEFLYIHGENGSGKTHLLQALAHQTANIAELNLAYLPLESDALVPELLSSFEAFDCVCLDNIEVILTRENAYQWQESIFHLYNHLKDQNKSLVITANQAPSGLTCSLKDLQSRLSAMFIHEIKPLSDDDKKLYIQRKAKEKGLELADELASYMLSRGKRDLNSLNESMEKLDIASLQAKRKITKPFIKEVLDL